MRLNILNISLLCALSIKFAYGQTSQLRSEDDIADSVINIDAINIVAEKPVGTISNENYTVDSSSSATKLKLKLKETPQSVTSFTEKQLQDQNIQDIRDLVEQTPGLTANYAGPVGSGKSTRFFSRGFVIDNYQMDGVVATSESLGGKDFIGLIDPFMFEQIDVVRGSTGLTTGVGDASASINFKRKKPLYVNAGQFNVRFGSWKNFRQELDYSRVLNKSNSLRARIVLSNNSSKSFIERASTKAFSLYGVIQYDLTDKQQITLGASHQYFNASQVPQQGLERLASHGFAQEDGHDVVDERVSRSFNNTTSWTYKKFKVNNLFAEYAYHINDNWQVNANINTITSKRDGIFGIMGTYHYLPQQDYASYLYGNWDKKADSVLGDINLTGKFNLFKQEQRFIVGFNGYSYKEQIPGFDSPAMSNSPISGENSIYRNWVPISQWNFDIPIKNKPAFYTPWYGPNTPSSARDEDNSNSIIGPYATFNLKPHRRVNLLLGARLAKWKESNKLANKEYKDSKNQVVKYFGLTIELSKHINFFASYADIFKSSQSYGPTYGEDGKRIVIPVTGNTIEFGLKGDFFAGALNYSLARFKIMQKNVPLIDYVKCAGNDRSPSCYNENGGTLFVTLLAGGYLNEGWDFNLAGKLTENWKIAAGYTYLKPGFYFANIPRDVSYRYDPQGAWNNVGGDSTDSFYAPKHMVKLFTSYNFGRLELGGGVTWQSKTEQNINGRKKWGVIQPAYNLVSLMARYKFNQNVQLGLNINNLFDTKYITNEKGSFQGVPRNYSLQLLTKF